MDKKKAIDIITQLFNQAIARGLFNNSADVLTVNEALYILKNQPDGLPITDDATTRDKEQ